MKLNYIIWIVVGLLLTSCASNKLSTISFRYDSTSKLAVQEHLFELPGSPSQVAQYISKELKKNGATRTKVETPGLNKFFSINDDNINCAMAGREHAELEQEAYKQNDFSLLKKINVGAIYNRHSAVIGCKKFTSFDFKGETSFVTSTFPRGDGFKTEISFMLARYDENTKIIIFGRPVAPNNLKPCVTCSIGWQSWEDVTGINEAQKIRTLIAVLKDNIEDISNFPPPLPPKIDNDKVSLASTGSGFVVNKNGIIATNYHVIKSCSKVEVENQEVDILAVDKVNDIAILKVDKQYENSVYFNIKLPSLAEDVYVYGFPLSSMLGENISITKGIVSSLTGMQGDYSQFRITAPIQAGNSGGPIVNTNGEVIGVTVSTLNNLYLEQKKGIHSQNVNFGIRSMLLTNMLEAKGIEFTLGARSIKNSLNTYEKTTKLVNCFM